MAETEKNMVAANGADLASDRQAAPAIEERNVWLDVMADVQAEMSRRFEQQNRRIARLEAKRGGLFDMPEEVRALLVMAVVYIAVSYILPMIGEWLQRWQQRQS